MCARVVVLGPGLSRVSSDLSVLGFRVRGLGFGKSKILWLHLKLYSDTQSSTPVSSLQRG